MSDETGTGTKTFGRYEVRDTLGRGGFAVVYRAWDPTLTRDVALKVLHPHLAEEPGFRARFLNEARAIAGLDHPNILPVYEVGDADGHPFFTMRLVHGDTLADLIAGGKPLPVAQVVAIIRDLASALDSLHAAGLVHRDLKPSNVMIEPSGRVSLMDFGIARIPGQGMTGTSLIIGTPEYMAPEQCRGLPAGPAADIYALGALTYHLLAGTAPFERADTAGLLFAHAYERPRPLRELAPNLPDAVYTVIESALEKDPASRPDSAGGFAAALLAAGGSETAPAPAGPSAARSGPTVPPTQIAPRPAGNVATGRADADSRSGQLDAMAYRAPAADPVLPGGPVSDVQTGRDRSAPRSIRPWLLATGAVAALLIGLAVVGLVVTRDGGSESVATRDVAVPAPDATATPAIASGAPSPAPAAPASGEPSVSTFAGSGQAGFGDGPGPTARFNGPGGIAVDRVGNLYVADTGNQRIRTIAPDGTVSAVAGSGDAGFADGSAVSARFNGPIGMAQGPTGALYVSDRDNHRIRRIVLSGEATTYAGTGEGGTGDGLSTAARFNGPTGLVFDGVGNLYITDFYGNQVRKITPAGVVSTIAGSGQAGLIDGPGTTARFNHPGGIGIDRAGNLYVADVSNHRVRKIAPDGVVSSVAGAGEPGFADGPAGSARFTSPTAVAVDGEGNVYVSDFGNHRIRRISPAGEVTTLAGTGAQGYADGPAGAARFDSPTGIVIDWSGDLYVAELGNRIRKITLAPGG